MPETYDASHFNSEMTKWAYDFQNKGNQVYDWAKNEVNKNTGIADQVTKAALENGSIFDNAAAQGVSRYGQMYAPAMQQQLQFAQEYSSPEKMALARGRAMAGVGQAYDAQSKAASDNLASYGLDPRAISSRLDTSVRTQRATAEAAAGEASDMNRELVGQQLLGQAINTGQTDAGITAQAGGLGMANRGQAVDTGLKNTAGGVNAMGNPQGWAQLQVDSRKTGEQGLWKAGEMAMANQQQKDGQSSGIGSLLGSGMGMFASMAPLMFSGGVVPAMEEGGPVTSQVTAIDTGMDPGMDPGMEGTIVPPGAGVPGIPGQDNVPALVAEGEGVLPQDVMKWRGEQWFQKEIMKARKEMQSQRVTTPKEAPQQAIDVAAQAGPTFASQGAMQ